MGTLKKEFCQLCFASRATTRVHLHSTDRCGDVACCEECRDATRGRYPRDCKRCVEAMQPRLPLVSKQSWLASVPRSGGMRMKKGGR